MIAIDSKERFSNRVENYVRYRPGYPKLVLETLREECGLAPDSVVADIGSGTGILTRLFLENGNEVYGVEPNARMREAGEEYLKTFPRFRSIDGTPNPQRWRLVAWVLSLLARLFTGLTRKGRARSLRAFLSRTAGSQLSGTIAKSMLVHSSAITNRCFVPTERITSK